MIGYMNSDPTVRLHLCAYDHHILWKDRKKKPQHNTKHSYFLQVSEFFIQLGSFCSSNLLAHHLQTHSVHHGQS